MALLCVWSFVAVLLCLSTPAFTASSASTPDMCSVLTLGICDGSFDLPTGFAVKKCGKPALPCGIRVTTKRVQPCTQAMRSWQDRAESGCRCVPELATWLAKAPALIQQGITEAADPFTGITSPLLTGVAQTAACVVNAGLQAKDVNKQQLLDQLAAARPQTTLAGVQAYDITYFPAITLATYLDFSTRVTGCVGTLGAAVLANPTAIAAVPLVCHSLVDFIATYADTTLRTVVNLAAQMLQPVMDYVEELLNITGQLFAALDMLVSDYTWNGFIASARQAAAAKGCTDPSTCFGGLLKDAWRELNKLTVALNGTHQAFITLQVASNTASDYLRLIRGIFCDGKRQLDDTSFRQLSLYKALALAISGESITPEALLEHPRIIAGVAAHFAALPHLATLKQLAATLKNQTAAVEAQFNQAIADFPGKAYAELDKLYSQLSEAVNPSPSCPGGQAPVNCFVDLCSPPFTPPNCGANSRCVTDRCAGCGVKCDPIPPTAADAASAYAVFVAWYDALRANTDLKDGTAAVKSLLPRLADSLLYLNSYVSSGLLSEEAQSDALRYGILTYNRRASVSMNLPCYNGNAEKCFKYQKWKACMKYPKFSNCRAAADIPMPNEHIPWVMTHAGIDDLMLTALTRLNPDLGAKRAPSYDICV